MPTQHDEGLIQQYVREIQALAVKAEAGENVAAATKVTIKKAREHFGIVKDSDPTANLAAFRGRLSITAEVSSLPKYKKTLEHAIALLSE